MKLKYYLRGLGIGIIITTIILMIGFSRKGSSLSDEEIIERASRLGMVMQEKSDAGGLPGIDDTDGNKGSLTGDDGGAASGENLTDPAKPDEDGGMAGTGDPAGAQGSPDGAAGDAQNAPDGVSGTGDPAGVQGSPDGTGDSGDGGTEGTPGGDATRSTQGSGAGTSAETPPGEFYHLVIERGDVCRTICERLAANGVISDAESVRKHLFELGYATSMSTGEYEIPYGLSMEEVADILRDGPVRY